MNVLSLHIIKIVLPDFVLKYQAGTTKLLPKLDQIILSSNLSINYKVSVAVLIGILTFIKPCLTLSQKNILVLNLRKGDPVGAKTILRQKSIDNFLTLFLFEMLPSLKKLSNLKFTRGTINWQIKDIFEYEDTFDMYIYIAELQGLDIVIKGKNLNLNFFAAWRLPTKNLFG
jgi:ribosomal protein L5